MYLTKDFVSVSPVSISRLFLTLFFVCFYHLEVDVVIMYNQDGSYSMQVSWES